MSDLWNYFLGTVVNWDHLTPQGIRFGIASFIALTVLAPGRPTALEVLFNTLLLVVVALLVAQAVSINVH